MKKIISTMLAVMVLSIIVTLAPANPQTVISAFAAPTLKIGDYMLMGKYYDMPILWRCVDIDENGPLLLSDRIISLKPFDAKGTHVYYDGTLQAESLTKNNRSKLGSNLWDTSNIRAWLNSNAVEGGVVWPDGCRPDAVNVFEGKNGYSNEEGFLSERNFTEGEVSIIKSVVQKQLLNELDQAKLNTSGSEPFRYAENVAAVFQNYEQAYAHNLEDKMFLLDIKQLNKLYQNAGILGTDYFKSKPTQLAVDKSEYKTKNPNYPINKNCFWYYWLRSPGAYASSGSTVRTVSFDGKIHDFYFASYSSIGVRPAFYLDTINSTVISGTGTDETDPYVVANSGVEPSVPPTLASTNSPIVAAPASPGTQDSNNRTMWTIIGISAFVLILIALGILIFILFTKGKRKPGTGSSPLNSSAVWNDASQSQNQQPRAKKTSISTCVNCGESMIPDSKFCTKCGFNNTKLE